MTDRERVIKSLKWENPNSLVVESMFSAATWQKYREKLEPVAERIANDFYKYVGPKKSYEVEPGYGYVKGEVFKDIWGCVWECRVSGMQGIITHHPLGNDWEGFESFAPPDPATTSDLWQWDRKEFEGDLKENVRSNKFIMAGGERLWERLHFLRGYENTMLDLAEDDSRIRRVIDMIVDYNISCVDKYLEYCEVDCILFGDDWGEQHRLMVSPEMWRAYFYDGYKRMFQHVRKAGKYVYFHTDGYLLPIVPDLIRAGASIINLQSGCHKLEDLKAVCQNKVCISVDVDRQKVMPFGSTEDMKNHIRDIYNVLEAANGGVWVKADIYPDTPLENIQAMCGVFEELRAPG